VKASEQMIEITGRLRLLILERWTDHNILDHVTIELPAPIFDRISLELASEMPTYQDHHVRTTGPELTFQGIKFKRLDGRNWRASTRSPDPLAWYYDQKN
jgi:hypothetical protein